MPKLKTKKSNLKNQLLADFEKQLINDERQEKQAQKLFSKQFIDTYKKEKRNDARLVKKQKLESRKINLKTKRKLKVSKLKQSKFSDKNNIEFISQQQDFFLSSPIVITLEFLNNDDFLNFLIATYSSEIIKFTNKFKKKNKFLFSIGYHFYFEGLAHNKTYAVGFRPKEEMPINQTDLMITIQSMFTEIKKRFIIYYNRANSHILKFKGITLEATPK